MTHDDLLFRHRKLRFRRAGEVGVRRACAELGYHHGADHFTNARMLGASGAAIVLDGEQLSAERVRDALTAAMGDAAQSAARQIATEIATMPPAEAVVPVLEAITSTA